MYKYFAYLRVFRVPKMKIYIRHEIYRVISCLCMFMFPVSKIKTSYPFLSCRFRFVLACQIARLRHKCISNVQMNREHINKRSDKLNYKEKFVCGGDVKHHPL